MLKCQFCPFLESDARHWFETLRDWSFSFNSLDHKMGFKCLDAFLRVIGQAFKTEIKSGSYFFSGP